MTYLELWILRSEEGEGWHIVSTSDFSFIAFTSTLVKVP